MLSQVTVHVDVMRTTYAGGECAIALIASESFTNDCTIGVLGAVLRNVRRA